MMRIIALLAALLFAACTLTGGGTDVGNPDLRVSGSLLRSDGKPAAWVQVRLRPKTFLSTPDSQASLDGSNNAIQDQITDTQGFFTFDSVPKGDYRIQATDAGLHGAMMEFTADGKAVRMTLAPATMDTTGRIDGKVNYRGPARPQYPKVFVSVFGLDRWTATNDAGEFTLSDLPAGKYSLRITTDVGVTLTAMVPETPLAAGGQTSVGTVDLGP
jgi:hypothetical protein